MICIKAAKEKHIDRVIITDHNRIDGAILANEKFPDIFIIGEEVMTTEGELLAAFVKEVIPERIDSDRNHSKYCGIKEHSSAFPSI